MQRRAPRCHRACGLLAPDVDAVLLPLSHHDRDRPARLSKLREVSLCWDEFGMPAPATGEDHLLSRALVICWIVSASVIRTIDGDTAVFAADIWPGLQGTVTVRLLGVDTPEMKGETRPAAEKAREFTRAWLDKGDVMLAIGCGAPAQDHFGRYLGRVTRDGKALADDLIAAGHGVKR